jgi:hypothetical protein
MYNAFSGSQANFVISDYYAFSLRLSKQKAYTWREHDRYHNSFFLAHDNDEN